MGLGKTYSTKYLADSNNNTGAAGQVLISTSTGINWSDGTDIIGGPYLPLAAGSGYPLTGDLLLRGTYNPYTQANRGNITLNGSNTNIIAFTNNTVGKGYIYHNGTDLEILNAGTGVLKFAAGDAEKVRITPSGNVGIGTTSPNNILELYKTVDSAIGPVLQLTNSQYTNADNSGSSIQFRGYTIWGPGSSNPRYSEINAINGSGSVPKRIEFKFYADTDVKTPLSILQTGNVGIGTTDPGATLDVNGTGYYSNQLTVDGFDNNAGISFRNGFTPTNVGIRAKAITTANRDGLEILGYNGIDFTINNGDTVAVRINGQGNTGYAGNVGIGTTSPTHKLQVVGDGAFNSTLGVQDPDVSSNGLLKLSHDSTGSSIYSNPASSNVSTVVLRLGINNSEKMRIANNGNVGIGTTSPVAKLEVKSPSYNAVNAIANFVNGNNPVRVSYDTVVIAQTDVPTLSIVETIDGSQASEQKLTFSVGDGKAVIASTSTATQGMYFNVNRDTSAPAYNTSNGITALKISNDGKVGIGTTSPKATLDVKGGYCVDTKSVSITESPTTVLTVRMSNHTGCYVKITAFGDWAAHSSIAYLGEFFLQNGAGGYAEPGTIIRQEDNTHTDAIQAEIVDPGGTGERDFTITLRATATASFTAQLTYNIQGQFISVS
jgi:hypothetical protein